MYNALFKTITSSNIINYYRTLLLELILKSCNAPYIIRCRTLFYSSIRHAICSSFALSQIDQDSILLFSFALIKIDHGGLRFFS